MKKKTAISQTLDWISRYRKQNGGDYPKPDEIEAQLFMQKETERKQIEEAYDQGINDEHDNNNYQEFESASDYFTQTYEQ